MKHLPPESAYRTAIRDSMTDAELRAAGEASEQQQGYGAWGLSDHLLARIGDLLDVQVYIEQAKAGAKGVRKPQPFPRPGVGQTVDMDALRLLQRRRELRGAHPTE